MTTHVLCKHDENALENETFRSSWKKYQLGFCEKICKIEITLLTINNQFMHSIDFEITKIYI